jgi:hypothetical protein
MNKPLEPLDPLVNGAEAPIEVIVGDNAASAMTDDGGAVVVFGDEPREEPEFGANLAEYIDHSTLATIASDLIEDFQADKLSRKDWEKTYMEGLDLLGLKFEDRTEPWDGACGVFHPMLTDSIVRFQAQTIQEIFPASGPAKTTVVGKLTADKTKQAGRVREYMNYSATKRMPEYRNETERLLFSLPIAGSSFRKVYYDPNLGREASMFVPAEDFVVNYGASDLATVPCATHIMKRNPNYVRKLQIDGFYLDIELDAPAPDFSDLEEKISELTGHQSGVAEHDSRHTLLEMHVEYDLPGFEDQRGGKLTGIKLPYVITIEKSSQQVLGIRRNWIEGDEKRLKREHFVHYPYLPGLGFYGFGLVHMIGGLSKSATSLLRQLVDAGTLANLPGGLKSRGLRIKGDDSPILPGEFRDVDVHSGAIKDNITFLPYKDPSNVLYQLLGDLVNEGRRFASAADIKAADMNAEAPVGTTLAILEREMKVLSAVQARVHEAMGKELQILADLIRQYGPKEYPYEIEGEHTIADDFDERVDIIPVSDPNAGTMAQRIMQYQAALQLAAQSPQLYDLPLLHRQMLQVLGIQEAEKIVPSDEDMKPLDPITENMNIIRGEPIKAFMYQDHEAHIQAHMAAAQHPQLLEMMEKNPNIKAVQAAAAAHLAEHVAFLYRQKVEKELGTPLPDLEETLPEDIEVRLSRLVAPAAAQLTGKAAQQQKAEEDAKKQEDPIIQMQQEELRQKGEKIAGDNARNMEKVRNDLKIAMERIQIERDKLGLKRVEIDQDGMIEGAKIVAGVAGDQMDAEDKNKERASKEQIAGYQMGMDLARSILEGIRKGNEQ